MKKLYSSKACLKMAGGGDALPTPPGSAPACTDNNVSYHYPTSRFGFSMIWGKFCQSCFEITARTTLAQFGHFTLKSRVWFQKGGLTPKPQPLGAPLSLHERAWSKTWSSFKSLFITWAVLSKKRFKSLQIEHLLVYGSAVT